MKIIKCEFCGKNLRRKYPNQKCHDWCKVEYRKEQSRKTSNKYNRTYRPKYYNLGTSNLNEKPKTHVEEEIKEITNELRRFGLK
jgi:hypothetical protein